MMSKAVACLHSLKIWTYVKAKKGQAALHASGFKDFLLKRLGSCTLAILVGFLFKLA